MNSRRKKRVMKNEAEKSRDIDTGKPFGFVWNPVFDSGIYRENIILFHF